MKYSKIYQIGRIDPSESRLNKQNILNESPTRNSYLQKQAAIKKDFDDLRKLAIKMDLFKPSNFFFIISLLQIVFFHVLGYYIFLSYGYGPIAFICASISLIVAQVNIFVFSGPKPCSIDFCRPIQQKFFSFYRKFYLFI